MPHTSPSFATRGQALEGLATRARAGRAWLLGAAFPLWWSAGFDRAAQCFHERLDVTGRPTPGPRRVRVQARQTAAYAHAGRLGWEGAWRDAVNAGVDVLQGRALRADGGVRHMLDNEGAPVDSRRDLYDLAFVVFALAHAGRALARVDLIEAAEAHIAWIEAHWRHPAGGFLEGEVNPLPPRRQNPHMHMFEALLALYDVTRKPEHAERARRLFMLFTTRLYDSARGGLPEYFGDNWRPAPGEAGRHAEPGHYFEWAWLLLRYAALTRTPAHDAATRLHAVAESRGVDPVRGVAFDAFWIDGAPKDAGARLWPQTERLKANAALFALSGELRYASAAAQAYDALAAYLATPTPGLWRDRMQVDGAFFEQPAPASSFYHITVALDEFARLCDASA